MILNLTVENQRLTLAETPFVAEDTEGYIKCVFDFTTEDWNGTVKTAHFKNPKTGEITTQLLENDSCMVPPEALTDRGNVYFSLTGEKEGYRITTGVVSIFNAETIYGGEPSDPTPSQYDQIIAAVAESVSAAENAESIAENIQQQAESGAFKGDRGDIGPQGPQGEPGADGAAATVAVGTVTTGEPDTPASVTNSGTQNAAVLDFVIPQGVKGDKGDKGDTGPQGIQGEKGDKGDTGEKGTGIDDWVSALDLSAHSSKANALDILTLPAGGYIVTAGGYINVTGAGATKALDLSKGAYIAATSQGVSIVDGGSQYYLYSGIENSNSAYLPTYEEVEEMVAEKADEVKVSTSTGSGGNVNLRDKSDYRFEELSTLNLSLPTTVPDIFECNVTFESGETATILSYPADTIEFIGDECDTDGDFVPAAKTTYEINIKNLGYGRIRAFVKALEAQPVTVTPDYFVSARYNDWVRGAVTNGVFHDSSTRIRSGHHYYATGTEVIVKIPSDYQMTVSFYSKSGNSYVFQGALGGWLTGTASFTIEDGVNYVAFMYGLVNNTVAEPADGLNVEFLIKQPTQT